MPYLLRQQPFSGRNAEPAVQIVVFPVHAIEVSLKCLHSTLPHFLQTIIARETGHQRTIRPIVEDPADIFPRDACHRGEVALRNLLLNEDASLADVTAKRFGEAQ